MVAMPICPEAVDIGFECNLSGANSQEGCPRSFVVSKCAAGLVKEEFLDALYFGRGDHTLCKRVVCATWGSQILNKHTLGP